MNLRTQLSWLLDNLTTILAILGAIVFVAAVGTYLVLGQLNRVVIVLFAVAVGLWVYALLERPDQTAQTLTSRNVRYGSNTLVMSLAFVGIVALINMLASRYSTQLDLTQNQLYTLSPLSIQVESELKQPVHILAFYGPSDQGKAQLEDLLKEYTRHSNLVTYEFVDPQLKPGTARQYNVQFTGTTVLVSGDKQQSVTGGDEGSLTSALLKLERGAPNVAYYLTGHGELDFTTSTQDGATSAKSALEAQNYTLKSLNLTATGKVPSDASLVIVAGPTQPLAPQEVTALESYLDNGGKALILADRGDRAVLEPIAERYGVQIGDGIVVDPALSYPNDPVAPIIQSYQFSPVTKNLPQILLVDATSVTATSPAPAGVTVQPLAQTTDQSWLETDTKTIHYDPGVDPKGPLTVATSVTKSASDPKNETRIVFVGDVGFLANGTVQAAPTNTALLNNVADWLTSNEDLIQIQAKVPSDRTMTLTNVQLNLLLYGSAVFLPLLVLAGGLVVWWNRR